MPKESTTVTERRPHHDSAISGPSFLGLSDEPEEAQNEAAPNQNDFSYLLEDEPPHRGRAAMVIVVLVLLAVGIGVAWKWSAIRQYVAGVRQASPAVATSSAASTADRPDHGVATDVKTPAADSKQAVPPTPSSPSDATANNGPQMTAEPAQNPAASALPQRAAEPEPSAAAPAQPTTAAKENAPKQPPPAPPASAAVDQPAASAAPNTTAKASTAAKPSGSPAAAEDNTDTAAATPEPTPAKPKKVSAAHLAAPKPTKPADDHLLIMGENYLYGRGVQKNCDQALVYLKAAASARNPEAMSHLGAMYSIGQCVPQDRPAAYRWFTLARDVNPRNPWTERNRQMVWNQMTPAEQQRAGGPK